MATVDISCHLFAIYLAIYLSYICHISCHLSCHLPIRPLMLANIVPYILAVIMPSSLPFISRDNYQSIIIAHQYIHERSRSTYEAVLEYTVMFSRNGCEVWPLNDVAVVTRVPDANHYPMRTLTYLG